MIDNEETILDTNSLNQASSQGAPEAKFICLDDSALPEEAKSLVVSLKDEAVIFGRGGDSTVILAYKEISRMHARISPTKDGWELEDLNSTNGVWINNKRVTKNRLTSGDNVAIGSIPFRFELIKPNIQGMVTEYPDDPTDDKTMLFGDPNASNAMISACKKKDEAPDDACEAPLPAAWAKELAANSSAKKPASTGKLKKLFAVFLFLAVIGGAAYYYTTVYSVQQAQNTLVKAHQSKIKSFVSDYELYTNAFNYQSYAEEMQILDALFHEIQQGLVLYPMDIDLHNGEAIVTLLRLERQVAKLFNEKRDAEVLDFIEVTKRELLIHNSNMMTTEGRHDLPQFQEVLDLIDLLGITSQYIIFSHKYPFPSVPSNATITPLLKDDILRIRSLKKQFIELVKRNNRALLITFKCMGGVVKYVDDQSLILVEKWYSFAFKD